MNTRQDGIDLSILGHHTYNQVLRECVIPTIGSV
jgi:hypothetical protein